jgi:hypothetical protein
LQLGPALRARAPVSGRPVTQSLAGNSLFPYTTLFPSDRLADTLRARGIDSIWLAYAGSATVAEHGLPAVRWLEPHSPVRGWVAASMYSIKLGSLGRPGHDDFAWLERHEPVALVGQSILLYRIP